MDKNSQILLLIFVGIAAFSILMQAGFTLAMFIGARKAQKKIMGLADDVRLHALPVVIASREIIQDLSPKIRTIAENVTATSASNFCAEHSSIENVAVPATSVPGWERPQIKRCAITPSIAL